MHTFVVGVCWGEGDIVKFNWERGQINLTEVCLVWCEHLQRVVFAGKLYQICTTVNYCQVQIVERLRLDYICSVLHYLQIFVYKIRPICLVLAAILIAKMHAWNYILDMPGTIHFING